MPRRVARRGDDPHAAVAEDVVVAVQDHPLDVPHVVQERYGRLGARPLGEGRVEVALLNEPRPTGHLARDADVIEVDVGERDVVERPEVDAEVVLGELLGERPVETLAAVAPALGLGRRRRQAAVPQQRAGGMVDDVAGHDQLADIGLVVGDAEALDRVEAQPPALEDVQLERLLGDGRLLGGGRGRRRPSAAARGGEHRHAQDGKEPGRHAMDVAVDWHDVPCRGATGRRPLPAPRAARRRGCRASSSSLRGRRTRRWDPWSTRGAAPPSTAASRCRRRSA